MPKITDIPNLNFIGADIPSPPLTQTAAADLIPRRKPDFATVQRMSALDDLMQTPEFFERLRQDTLASAGVRGAKIFPVVGGKIKRGKNEVIAGRYNPEKPSPLIEKLIKKAGFSDKFDEDIITLSQSFIPKDTTAEEISTILHELRHRGLQQLRRSGVDVDRFLQKVNTRQSLIGSRLEEEDFVRISGILSGTEDKERNKKFLAQKLKISENEVDKIIKDPLVQTFIVMLQKAAAGFLQAPLAKQENVSATHFPSRKTIEKRTGLVPFGIGSLEGALDVGRK